MRGLHTGGRRSGPGATGFFWGAPGQAPHSRSSCARQEGALWPSEAELHFCSNPRREGPRAQGYRELTPSPALEKLRPAWVKMAHGQTRDPGVAGERVRGKDNRRVHLLCGVVRGVGPPRLTEPLGAYPACFLQGQAKWGTEIPIRDCFL